MRDSQFVQKAFTSVLFYKMVSFGARRTDVTGCWSMRFDVRANLGAAVYRMETRLTHHAGFHGRTFCRCARSRGDLLRGMPLPTSLSSSNFIAGSAWHSSTPSVGGVHRPTGETWRASRDSAVYQGTLRLAFPAALASRWMPGLFPEPPT